MPGTLFVVATPIGNLEDITFRAVRTLREVDLIAAEDTRRTAKLLSHYDIHTPMVSLHEHNEFREAPRLLARLLAGESIAVVSDAGTPGIADPGALLVRAARDAGLTPVPIPGPSAVTAALSVAGSSSSPFIFLGFPPAKGTARIRWIARLKREQRTAVFFESPHRIIATLRDVASELVERQIDIFRELTKINYELVIQQNNLAPERVVDIGEFVVVVHASGSAGPGDELSSLIGDLFGYLTEHIGLSQHDAEVVAGDAFGVPDEEVDLRVRRANKLAKQQKMKGR
jgi:16S rRNA (cytidine1402-2'-O)-methyltransferase